MSGALLMALVAVAAGGLGLVLLFRPAKSEAARYGRRIAVTMLIALAAALLLFAFVLGRMGPG